MSGWVYVFANAVVPNHVKVGFTERDPALRAKELAATGLPGEYTVEFAVEVIDPRHIEREAHRILGDSHYHKEWFECTVAHARQAIETALAGDSGRQWGKELDEDDDSPLVPGHALQPYFGLQSRSQPAPVRSSQTSIFTLAPERQPLVHPSPMPPGQMEYTCKFCEHSSIAPVSHLARCTYCGKTDVVA